MSGSEGERSAAFANARAVADRVRARAQRNSSRARAATVSGARTGARLRVFGVDGFRHPAASDRSGFRTLEQWE